MNRFLWISISELLDSGIVFSLSVVVDLGELTFALFGDGVEVEVGKT
jgi:hypothetical protein